MEHSGRIVVHRPDLGWRDRNRRAVYQVEVDGARVAELSRGQQAEVPVTAGAHEVRATLGWAGSPVVQVEVPTGQTVRLAVEPAGSWMQTSWRIWQRHGYLQLVQG